MRLGGDWKSEKSKVRLVGCKSFVFSEQRTENTGVKLAVG